MEVEVKQFSEIIDHYNQCHKDYEDAWRIHVNNSIHYGFHDNPDLSHDEALIRMNQVLSEKASITSSDKILDAGCGIGGSSIWISKNIGAKTVGISIVPMQIDLANQLAKKNNLNHLTKFCVQNYLETEFDSESFDVVWAIESVCHASDKGLFLNEAYRLLKKGGRLIMSDAFLLKKTLSSSQEKNYQGMCRGWAFPNLANRDEIINQATNIGFRKTKFENVTEFIKPSSRRMYKDFFLFYPIALIQYLAGKRNKLQWNNAMTGYYQYHVFSGDFACYGHFMATK